MKTSKKYLKNIFKNLLPSNLIQPFLQYMEIDGERQANQVTKEEREKITNTFLNWSFSVSRVRPFTDSMVTRGGVSVKEINPVTMESKILSGLFFAGEVIDIDGKTGGYNLQAAFTTGYLAGLSAADNSLSRAKKTALLK